MLTACELRLSCVFRDEKAINTGFARGLDAIQEPGVLVCQSVIDEPINPEPKYEQTLKQIPIYQDFNAF